MCWLERRWKCPKIQFTAPVTSARNIIIIGSSVILTIRISIHILVHGKRRLQAFAQSAWAPEVSRRRHCLAVSVRVELLVALLDEEYDII